MTKIYCIDCEYLENHANGMSEVFPQWACESPALSVNKRNWHSEWIDFRGFWFWQKPRWRNRHKDCPDFKATPQKENL